MGLSPQEKTRVMAGLKTLADVSERLQELEELIGNFKDVRAAKAEAEAHIKKQQEREEARVREEDRHAKAEVALKAAAEARAAVERANAVLEGLQKEAEADKPKTGKKKE